MQPAIQAESGIAGYNQLKREHVMETLYSQWVDWYYPYADTDWEIEWYLNCESSGSWLGRAREALFLSQTTVANRLGVSRPTWDSCERSDRNGSVSLNTLRKCAEVMDCELIYVIRPKAQVRFSRIIWRAALPYVAHCKCAWCAHAAISNPKVRRKFGWSRYVSKK